MTPASEMKGFLSFQLLWLISKKRNTGALLTAEIERRKGSRPSPGTIYPCLKQLKERGLISVNKAKEYTLTAKGKKELDEGLKMFCTMFADFDEMKGSCCD